MAEIVSKKRKYNQNKWDESIKVPKATKTRQNDNIKFLNTKSPPLYNLST
jgi:hypothetical protein